MIGNSWNSCKQKAIYFSFLYFFYDHVERKIVKIYLFALWVAGYILFVTGIMKMSIVLISGSSCLDDGTPRKDAAEGEYTPTVGMFHF